MEAALIVGTMMRPLQLGGAFFFLLAGVLSSAEPPANVEHVLIIGCDGLRANALEAPPPTLRRLMSEGAYTLHARAVLPTESAPNWASLISGAGPEQHGVTSNAWKPDAFLITPTVRGPSGSFPTIFSVLRAERPPAVIACFHEWDDFGRLVEPDVPDVIDDFASAEETIAAAADCLKEKKPQLTFVHLDLVDHAGHEHGFASAEYDQAVKKADKLIASLLDSLKQAGLRETTMVFVVSDHGGKGKGHGGSTMEEIEIPWLIIGPGISRGKEISSPVNIYDTAATVAYVLRLKPPKAWIAHPVLEAFEDSWVSSK